MHRRFAVQVDAHAVELDEAAQSAIGAAHQGAAAGGEFGGFEGFCEKIVGAEIQRLDLVAQGAAGGEDESGQALAAAAQAAHQTQAIGAGQTDVDHGHGELLVGDGRLGGFGAAHAEYGVVGRGEAARDGVGHDVVVFY